MTREHSLSYYHKNKDRINARRRELLKSNKRIRELAKIRRKKFMKLNPNKNSEYKKKYHSKKTGSAQYFEYKEKFPERYKAKIEYQRIYRKKKMLENKDFCISERNRIKKYITARNHSLRVRGSKLTKDMIEKLYIKFDNKCFFCGATENLSIDHVVSVKNGGDNSMENLQILCMSCNRKKSWK